MSTIVPVPSINATRLLRTVCGINTFIVPILEFYSPGSRMHRYRKCIYTMPEVGLVGGGGTALDSTGQWGTETLTPLASKESCDLIQILRVYLGFDSRT